MVYVDKAHSASAKWLDFAILMTLTHGDSLLLNQEIKNG